MSEVRKEKGAESERKVGVYVCRCGGNISDHVDVEKVCEQASKDYRGWWLLGKICLCAPTLGRI